MNVEQMVAQLYKVGHNVPPDLEAAITRAGPSVVVELLSVIEGRGMRSKNGDKEDWAASHAVDLLAAMGASEAIGPMLVALRNSDWREFFHDNLIDALAVFGAQVVDPVLQLRQSTKDANLQESLAWVLAKTQAKDERILPILCSYLLFDPEFAALCLVDYGDARALPWLYEAFDAYEEKDTGNPLANQALIEMQDAIAHLGGTLSTAQRAKYRAACAARQARQNRNDFDVRPHLWSDDPSPALWGHQSAYSEAVESPRQRRHAKLGRNDLCWCDSGRKYKKCHEQGDRQNLYA